ncbi:hypothetical protein [Nocardioides sp.]|uniref:hypothetical protein n=1 Tax=Nocardioides sp. TaxID=35761 RepID=UPI003517D829
MSRFTRPRQLSGTAAAVGVWFVVVAVCSTLVWTVISAAGDSFTHRSSALPAAPGSPADGSVGPAATVSTSPGASPSARPSGRASGGPSSTGARGEASAAGSRASSTTGAGASAGSGAGRESGTGRPGTTAGGSDDAPPRPAGGGGSGSGSSGSGSSGSGSSGSGTSTPAPPPATPTRSRTWTGAPGVVTTRCTGPVIELSGASASADGYTVEVKDRGPQRVEVEFEGRGEDTVQDTRVRARCVGGTPVYQVEADD